MDFLPFSDPNWEKNKIKALKAFRSSQPSPETMDRPDLSKMPLCEKFDLRDMTAAEMAAQRAREMFQLEPSEDPNDLMLIMAQMPETEWEPGAWYSVDGDILHMHLAPNSYYARWHNHFVTTLHDHEGHDTLVGLQIWGLKELLKASDFRPRDGDAGDRGFRCRYYEPMDELEVWLTPFAGPGMEAVSEVQDIGAAIRLFKTCSGDVFKVEIRGITRLIKVAEGEPEFS